MLDEVDGGAFAAVFVFGQLSRREIELAVGHGAAVLWSAATPVAALFFVRLS
jgi:hypothetical protein